MAATLRPKDTLSKQSRARRARDDELFGTGWHLGRRGRHELRHECQSFGRRGCWRTAPPTASPEGIAVACNRYPRTGEPTVLEGGIDGTFVDFAGPDGEFTTNTPRVQPATVRLYDATGELLLRTAGTCSEGIPSSYRFGTQARRRGDRFFCGRDALFEFDLTLGVDAPATAVEGAQSPAQMRRTQQGFVGDGQSVDLTPSGAVLRALPTTKSPKLDARDGCWLVAGVLGEGETMTRFGCGLVQNLVLDDHGLLVVNTSEGGTFAYDMQSSALRWFTPRSAQLVDISTDGARCVWLPDGQAAPRQLRAKA